MTQRCKAERTSGRITGAIVEIEFLREDCLLGHLPDTSVSNKLGGFARDVDRTECPRGNGVLAKPKANQGKPAVASVRNIETLLPLMTGKTLCLEFWFKGGTTTISETTLAAIGTLNSLSTYAIRLDQKTNTDPEIPNEIQIKAQNIKKSIIVMNSFKANGGTYTHAVIDLQYLTPTFNGWQFYEVTENTTINATLSSVFHYLSI
jgi:hypothetical protein